MILSLATLVSQLLFVSPSLTNSDLGRALDKKQHEGEKKTVEEPWWEQQRRRSMMVSSNGFLHKCSCRKLGIEKCRPGLEDLCTKFST